MTLGILRASLIILLAIMYHVTTNNPQVKVGASESVLGVILSTSAKGGGLPFKADLAIFNKLLNKKVF